eukprot:s3215_g6.t1
MRLLVMMSLMRMMMELDGDDDNDDASDGDDDDDDDDMVTLDTSQDSMFPLKPRPPLNMLAISAAQPTAGVAAKRADFRFGVERPAWVFSGLRPHA